MWQPQKGIYEAFGEGWSNQLYPIALGRFFSCSHTLSINHQQVLPVLLSKYDQVLSVSPYLHCFHPVPSHLVHLSPGCSCLWPAFPVFLPQTILSTSLREIPVKSQIMWLLYPKSSNGIPLHSWYYPKPLPWSTRSIKSIPTISYHSLPHSAPDTQAPCFFTHTEHIPLQDLYTCRLLSGYRYGYGFAYSGAQLKCYTIREISFVLGITCGSRTLSKDLTSTLLRSFMLVVGVLTSTWNPGRLPCQSFSNFNAHMNQKDD